METLRQLGRRDRLTRGIEALVCQIPQDTAEPAMSADIQNHECSEPDTAGSRSGYQDSGC